jgi:hypothetical protein
VKKKRRGGQEALGTWTVCTLKMPKDRNALTPNHLPALICGTIYCKSTNKIRYSACTEKTIIQGTLGREQLEPLPHKEAKGVGLTIQPWIKKSNNTNKGLVKCTH